MLSMLIVVIVIQCRNRSHLSQRPLKLDHKVLISARMWFWSRIKKVCHSSFLIKPRQNPCFLADDLASGHISGNPAYLPGWYCLPICTCRLAWMDFNWPGSFQFSCHTWLDCVCQVEKLLCGWDLFSVVPTMGHLTDGHGIHRTMWAGVTYGCIGKYNLKDLTVKWIWTFWKEVRTFWQSLE
jgi:hypothetical protein